MGLIEKAAADADAAAILYRLTPRGDGLRPMLDALYTWGDAMARELGVDIATAARPGRRRP